MGSILGIIKNYWYVLAVILLLVIRLFFFFRKRKKERKKMKEMAQLKYRDDALNAALRNPLVGDVGRRKGGSGPLEVRWNESTGHMSQGDSRIMMVEITELSAYASKKYVFRPDEVIALGSAKDCSLVLAAEDAALRHCVIFSEGSRILVRSMPGTRTYLRRKNSRTIVGTEGVYVNDGDQILIGRTALEIRRFISG